MHNQNKLNFFIWTVPFLNSTGRSIYDLAFIWMILEMTGSEKITGLVAMTSYVPAILFGIFLGSMVDSFSKTKIISYGILLQILVLLIFPFSFKVGIQSIGLFVILAFLHNAFSLPMVPAFNSYLPTKIKKESLLKANSIVNVSWQIAVFIGPIIASQLLSSFEVQTIFFFCCFFYLLASLIAKIAPADDQEYEKIEFAKILSKTREGFNYLLSNKTFLTIVLLTVVSNLFVMGPAIVGIPVLVKIYLGGSAADFALTEAFVGVGMLLGTALVYRLSRIFSHGKLFLLGLFIDGGSFCFYYFVSNLLELNILSFLHGIGIPFLIISRVSILQKHVPEKLLGRIFAIISTSIVGMTAFSSGIFGLLSDFIEAPTIFLIFGILASFCGIIGYLNPNIKTLN